MPEPTPQPIKAWPLIGMLIIVVFIILWFNGYFA